MRTIDFIAIVVYVAGAILFFRYLGRVHGDLSGEAHPGSSLTEAKGTDAEHRLAVIFICLFLILYLTSFVALVLTAKWSAMRYCFALIGVAAIFFLRIGSSLERKYLERTAEQLDQTKARERSASSNS